MKKIMTGMAILGMMIVNAMFNHSAAAGYVDGTWVSRGGCCM